MHHYSLLLPLLLFGKSLCVIDESDVKKYCEISQSHVLCKYFGVVGCSSSLFEEVIPTEKHQIEILHWHNSLRQKVAYGLKGENQAAATNMMKMQWDPELADIAQILANQCLSPKNCSVCRSVLGGRFSVGEIHGYYFGPYRKEFTFTRFFEIWFQQVRTMPRERFNSFVYDEMYSKYSQLVWWNTRSVGCGGVSFQSPLRQSFSYIYSLVCMYGPEGNVPGRMIYAPGQAGKGCPVGTQKDDEYPGLCAISTENFNVTDEFPTDKIQLLPEIFSARRLLKANQNIRDGLKLCKNGTEFTDVYPGLCVSVLKQNGADVQKELPKESKQPDK